MTHEQYYCSNEAYPIQELFFINWQTIKFINEIFDGLLESDGWLIERNYSCDGTVMFLAQNISTNQTFALHLTRDGIEADQTDDDTMRPIGKFPDVSALLAVLYTVTDQIPMKRSEDGLKASVWSVAA